MTITAGRLFAGNVATEEFTDFVVALIAPFRIARPYFAVPEPRVRSCMANETFLGRAGLMKPIAREYGFVFLLLLGTT